MVTFVGVAGPAARAIGPVRMVTGQAISGTHIICALIAIIIAIRAWFADTTTAASTTDEGAAALCLPVPRDVTGLYEDGIGATLFPRDTLSYTTTRTFTDEGASRSIFPGSVGLTGLSGFVIALLGTWSTGTRADPHRTYVVTSLSVDPSPLRAATLGRQSVTLFGSRNAGSTTGAFT